MMSNSSAHSKQPSRIKNSACKTHDKYYKYCQKCNDYKHYKNTSLRGNKTVEEISNTASSSSGNNHLKKCLSTSKKFNQYLKNSKSCNFCYESDHSETDCYQKITQDYYSKYCHYCEEHGHIEDTCPLVEKATRDLKKQYQKDDDRKQSKHLRQSVGIRKSLTDSTLCTYCKKFNHNESECFIKEQAEYYSKYCHYCEEHGHFEDTCPLVEQAAKEQSTYVYKKKNRMKISNNKIKNGNDLKNLKACNFCQESDHSETDCYQKMAQDYYSKYCHYCEEHGHFEDTCPLVEKAAKEQSTCAYKKRYKKKISNNKVRNTNALKNLKVCNFCHESDHSETDCCQKIAQDYYSKYCHYCKEHGHLEDTCPLVEQAAKEQSAYVSKNKNKKKLLNKQTKDLENMCKYCYNSDHSESECKEKIHNEGFNEYCYYCEEYGHCEDTCPMIEKATKYFKKQFQNNSFDNCKPSKHLKESVRISKKLANSKLCSYCKEYDHDESECFIREQAEYYSKYCHYCEEHGHFEDTCPLVEQAAKEQSTGAYKKKYKKKISNNKVGDTNVLKNLMACNFCQESDHSETDCYQKMAQDYYSKYCHYCEEHGHFEDTCPLVEKAAKEQSTCTYKKRYKKKISNNKVGDTNALKNLMTCNFCHESDHSETDCYQKMAQDYYGKYCHYCEKHGHFEDTCPLVGQAVKEQSAYVYKKKNKKKSANNKTKGNAVLENVCKFDNESSYREPECSKKVQYEDYISKYCYYCEEYGHVEDACQLVKNATTNFKKQAERSSLNNSTMVYRRICNMHNLCENCHP